MQWDIYFFQIINGLAGRFDWLDALGVFAAVFLLPLMMFLLILAAFTIKKIKESHWYEMPVAGLAALACAYVLRFIVGELVGRARPYMVLENVKQLIPMEPLYNSFPSGHTALAFALAFIVYKHDRDWGFAFLLLGICVALGRVFVGVHYPLDIVGGAVIGWVGAEIVHRLEHAHWSKLARGLRG